MTQKEEQDKSVLAHLKDENRECPACGADMNRMTGDKRQPTGLFDWVCTSSDCRKVVDCHPEVRKLYRAIRSDLHCDNDEPIFVDKFQVSEQKEAGGDQVIVTVRRSTVWMSDLDKIREVAEEIGYEFMEIMADEGGKSRYKVRIIPDYDEENEEVKE